MPELPDLEVIREYLAPRLPGIQILSAEIGRPVVLRNLLGGDLAAQLAGRRFNGVRRRGKFVLFELDGPAEDAAGLVRPPAFLVINPMLAGRLRYGSPLARRRTRDALIMRLSDDHELRYNDQADMGKVYLTTTLERVPGFEGQGPEADDPALTLAVFGERLRHHHGEIKGILTNQAFVTGIGNAYADEILWSARIYPFRRRKELGKEELARLHSALQTVLCEAVATLRVRVGAAIDVEIRDFLAVHGKPGQPCPRCGTRISEVQRERIATHFCRTCQPGLLIRQ
jgi:formamidopyrimidine-DNA glycosylase